MCGGMKRCDYCYCWNEESIQEEGELLQPSPNNGHNLTYDLLDDFHRLPVAIHPESSNVPFHIHIDRGTSCIWKEIRVKNEREMR